MSYFLSLDDIDHDASYFMHVALSLDFRLLKYVWLNVLGLRFYVEDLELVGTERDEVRAPPVASVQ